MNNRRTQITPVLSHSQQRWMGLTGSGLFFSGAILGCFSHFLPTFPVANTWGILIVSLLALPIALVLALFGQHLSKPHFHVIGFIGSLILTLSAVFAGPTPLAVGTMGLYLWIPLWICYFFPLWQGMIHVSILSVFSGAVLFSIYGAESLVLWLYVVGTNIVAAVAVGTLAKRNRELARIDALTGAFNRHEWEEAADREVKRAERHEYDISLVSLDLDHFKIINDEQGHAVGDRYLRELAESVTRQLRPEDVFARLGGDEFSILLPNCPQDQMTKIVKRLRTSLPQELSISMGIASLQPEETLESLQRRADQALYQAKNSGRNTYCFAGNK